MKYMLLLAALLSVTAHAQSLESAWQSQEREMKLEYVQSWINIYNETATAAGKATIGQLEFTDTHVYNTSIPVALTAMSDGKVCKFLIAEDVDGSHAFTEGNIIYLDCADGTTYILVESRDLKDIWDFLNPGRNTGKASYSIEQSYQAFALP